MDTQGTMRNAISTMESCVAVLVRISKSNVFLTLIQTDRFVETNFIFFHMTLPTVEGKRNQSLAKPSKQWFMIIL